VNVADLAKRRDRRGDGGNGFHVPGRLRLLNIASEFVFRRWVIDDVSTIEARVDGRGCEVGNMLHGFVRPSRSASAPTAPGDVAR
jgi:hypothetical protein